MNLDQPFPFDWSNHGPAYNQQVQGLLGGSQRIGSSSSTFEAPFQEPFQAGMANNFQPYNDISMKGNEEEGQPAPAAPIAQARTGPFHRATGEHLDWNTYKDTIWSLYIDQNKSLVETIQDMENLHSFKAS